MSYYADPTLDLPAPWKAKRIVFYARGLKVYGQIPYILQRRLQAKFYSNDMSLFGGRIVGPTREHNYTVISYRLEDGSPHSAATLEALIDWLYSDKGFEFGIADPENFEDQIAMVNWFNSNPHTVQATENHRVFVAKMLSTGQFSERGPK